VFNQLVRLSILSPWIVSQVTRSPILLDELIDPLSLFNVPTKEELRDDLDKALLSIPPDDTEGQMEALRIFKQVNVLRVAASDLTGVIPVMVVSDKLTDIAEVIVEKVVTLSWRSVCEQYGAPVNETIDDVSGFAVIAFGKMGGIELGFSSDLDIIFLHKDGEMDEQTTGDRSISLGEFYMRLGRKIISYMVTRTFSGLLYEMDLRLRPNGQSGLLVSSESAFEQYQQQNAWTWEHQALIRARFVAGCDRVAKRFKQIRHAVLKQSRDSHALRKEVIEMREKMRSTLLNKKPGYFDLKHGVGGIVDIEFIVQFGVLENANNHPALLVYTDNIRLLDTLNKIGFLSDSQQKGLNEAYQAYRKASHHASLAENPKMVLVEEVEHHVQLVTSVWDEMIING
jgi:Glutamine synthetase adenylyltransferase